MTKSFADVRQHASRPEKTVLVCMAGALVAEHEELDRQLQEHQPDPNAGIEGDSRSELAEQIRALEERMREATFPFRLRALKRAEYRALKDDCPPRRDSDGEYDPRDAQRGFNLDKLYDRLVPVSIIDPLLPEKELREVLDELTDGQFVELGNAAYMLNEGLVSVPFSRAASAILQSSGSE